MTPQEDVLDPEDLFGSGLVTEVDTDSASALQEVVQRISGHYGEIIATWSARVLATTEPADTSGMEVTVANLLRLAESSGEEQQLRLLRELSHTLTELSGTRPRTRRGESARIKLRDWIPAFAETLTGEDSARLLALVRWDAETMPLLDELREIRGIGPRRLTRLYSAGLGSVDAVADADPADVAAVTGIPLGIAESVVRRAGEFAVQDRARCIHDIQRRAVRLEMLLTRIGKGPNPELVDAAREALAQVEHAFTPLFTDPEPR